MASRTLEIVFVGDPSGAQRAMQAVGGETEKLGGKFSGLKSAIGGVATVAAGFVTGTVIVGGFQKLTGFMGEAAAAASNLEQSAGGVESVFGAASEKIFQFGESAAQAVGLSKNQVNELASATGAFLQNYGMDADAAADQTLNLTQRAADMAATFGGSVSDAMAAIQAGLRGQADPLERYGVSLTAARVEAHALAMTGKTLTSELTDQEKMAARLDLVFQQTAASQGQFGRESETAAGKAERLRAQQENLAAQMGEHLLPMQIKVTEAKAKFIELLATKVVPFIAEKVIPVIQDFTNKALPAVQEFARGVAAYWESDLKPALDNIVAAWEKLEPVIRPILEFLVREVGRMAGIVKEALQLVVNIIQGDFRGAWENAKEIVRLAIEGILDRIRTAKTVILELVPLMGEAGKALMEGLWNGLKGFWDDTVKPFLTGLPGEAASAMGDVGRALWNKGRDLIQGFIDGMKSIPIPNPLDMVPGAGMVGGAIDKINPFAAGTPSAPPGWALVGEEGPELVHLRGGERIFPAAQTAAMLGGRGGQLQPFVVQLQLDGRVIAETVVEPYLEEQMTVGAQQWGVA